MTRVLDEFLAAARKNERVVDAIDQRAATRLRMDLEEAVFNYGDDETITSHHRDSIVQEAVDQMEEKLDRKASGHY